MIPVADYPIILFWLFVTAAPFFVAFIVWISKTLTKQNVALAVLVSETRPTLKLTNEIIDLKLADAVLTQSVLNNTKSIQTLFNNWETYYNRMGK